MAAGLDVLVELAGEVEPLQHELERGRGRGRLGRAEPGDGRLERGELADLADVLARRHRVGDGDDEPALERRDRKSTRLNSSHSSISYAVFCLKKKKKK